MKEVRSLAPLRLGLAGGGTDIDLYCNKYTGIVLNATVSLYVHCVLREREDGKILFEAQDIGEKIEYKVSDYISYDGKLDLYKAIYNRLVKDFNIKTAGFSLYTYSDVPSGSGLGGSSTLVVAIIAAFVELYKLPLGDYDIAKLAFSIEREDMKIVGGAQDQYASTFGGFNYMEFYDKNKVIVNPLRVKNWIIKELEERLVLYFTNITRQAKDVEEHKKGNLQTGKSLEAMHAIKQDAIDMKEALLKADFDKLAEILGKSWKSKKIISEIVSNDAIDKIYNLAIENGAYSGKISGAGAGGFMFFMVDPKNKHHLCSVLNKTDGYVQSFRFEKQGVVVWTI